MSAQVPPPPPQPPVPSGQPLAEGKTGPGRKWYLIAFVIFAVIFVPSLLVFLNGFDGITEGLTRVQVPGETEVSLEEGTWTVFYEWAGEFEGQPFTTSSEFPGMEAVVITDDGEQIPVTPSNASFNYNIGGHSGFSVGEVDIPADDEYVFAARHVDPTDTQPFVVALGRNLGRATVQLVLGIIGMIGAALAAFVIWLIVIILRSRAKRRLQAGYYA